MSPEPTVDVATDADELAERAAAWLARRIARAPGRFAIALSGGSTPRRLYELLGGPDFRGRIDWRKIHFFWGDERFVPPSHADSNFRMAFEAMIRHLPISEGQIHAAPTGSRSPEQAAALYAQTLQGFYGAGTFDPERPLFDVTLLGLGEDGHIASLFPGSPALDEREAWATAIIGVKPEPRISLTYPALDSSAAIVFLVSGAQKRDILARLLANDQALPAARLATRGAIRVFADSAART